MPSGLDVHVSVAWPLSPWTATILSTCHKSFPFPESDENSLDFGRLINGTIKFPDAVNTRWEIHLFGHDRNLIELP